MDASADADPEVTSNVDLEVKRTWGTFTDAVLAKDGDLAASLVTTETQALYGRYRDDALRLPAAALAGRTPVDQFSIMGMRAKFDPDELRSLPDERVLSRVFELGLVDESTYITTDIVEVNHKGQTALADVIADGTRVNAALLFREQGGQWKLDLAENFGKADAGFTALAERRDLTVPEFVDQLVEIQYGVSAVSDLRQPLDG